MIQNNKDKIQGIIQLVAVIVFIVGSMIVVKLLESKKITFNKNSEKREFFVKVKEFSKINSRINFDISGILKAKVEVDIVPEVSGRVIKVDENFFNSGSFKKNKILFEIEPKDFIFEVNRLKAEVKKAETAYELERVESRLALTEWYQFNPNKSVAPDLVARKPQLEEALANLNASQAMLQNAKLDLERTKFKLPFSGKVTTSTISVGQFISSGQSYGKVFDSSTLEIESLVSSWQQKWLYNNQNIVIKIKVKEFGEEKTYDGILKRGFANLEETTRFGKAIFGFVNNDNFVNLISGSFVKVSIDSQILENVFIFPSSALQGENIIWFVDKENILKKFDGEILYQDNDKIVIKNDNLEKVKIVVGKISGGFEGMKVLVGKDEF